MPKVFTSSSKLKGCLVIGRWVTVTGIPIAEKEVIFQPKYGGTWNNMIVSESSIPVKTDKNGNFRVVLVPSVAVGEYKAIFGNQIFSLNVPEQESIDFFSVAKLIQAAKQK